jgi:hypothetical protein
VTEESECAGEKGGEGADLGSIIIGINSVKDEGEGAYSRMGKADVNEVKGFGFVR